MRYCEFCGSDLPLHASFCGNCGHPVGERMQDETFISNSAEQDFQTSNTTPLVDQENDKDDTLLPDMLLPELLAGQGQGYIPYANQVPLVQGTPQPGGVPSVPGTPQIPGSSPLSEPGIAHGVAPSAPSHTLTSEPHGLEQHQPLQHPQAGSPAQYHPVQHSQPEAAPQHQPVQYPQPKSPLQHHPIQHLQPEPLPHDYHHWEQHTEPAAHSHHHSAEHLQPEQPHHHHTAPTHKSNSSRSHSSPGGATTKIGVGIATKWLIVGLIIAVIVGASGIMLVRALVPGNAGSLNVSQPFTKGSQSAVLDFNPKTLDFGSVEVGRTVSLPLILSNQQGSPLQWTASVGGSGTNWLTLQNSNGTIAPHGSDIITVIADTSGLAAGFYSARLGIHVNGGGTQIPVTLNVVQVVPQPTATPSPTPSPIPTPSPTPTPTPTPTPSPTPVPATIKILGGVPHLDGYCQSIGDTTVSLDGNTAYDWRCVTPNGQHVSFSFTSACQWQYNDPQAVDRVLNYFDPYSWQCFTNAHKLGGVPHLDGYCQSIGDTTVSLDGNTAYDWRCVTPGGQHVSLSFTDACRWQYNDPQALDRMADYFNPSSWECWG